MTVDKGGPTLRQPTNPCLREADQSPAGTSAQKHFLIHVHRNIYYRLDKTNNILETMR